MARIEVFHDSGCPVCRAEIAFYRRIDRARRIAWTDILALADSDLPDCKSRAVLLGRFHVRETGAQGPGPAGPPSNAWHVGVDAFARIWRELPGFRLFHWIFAVPGIRQLAQVAYLAFVRWQARRRAHKS
jgi:predicted DCC family thiol-disulfide oxidoreductase YuxK